MPSTRSEWDYEYRYKSTHPSHLSHDEARTNLPTQYTLPKLQAPHPQMPKKVKSQQAPGASKSITIQLKSVRNPSLEVTIANAPISTTSVEDLKDAVRGRVADNSGQKVALEKIKILYKRKPVTGKTVAEVLADEPDMLAGGKGVEFGVMIIGGATVVEPAKETEQEDASAKPAGGKENVLETAAFWDDLQTYLGQRLKDDEQANNLRALFQNAWSSSR